MASGASRRNDLLFLAATNKNHARNTQENPPGQGRKTLIDWAAWEKMIGVRTGVSNQGLEEEMDVRDYIGYQRNRGYTEEEARALWQELLDDPRSEVSGEGADTTIMIQLKKKRIRSQEHFEEGAFKEGSKQQKNMLDEEKQRLINFSSTSASSFSESSHLREALSRGTSESSALPDGLPQQATDSARTSAGLAGPAAHTKYSKLVEPLRKQFDAACDALRVSQKAFEDLDAEARGNSKELVSYYKMASVRLHMARYAMSRKVLQDNMPVPTLDSRELLTVPGTPAASAPGTPAPSPQKGESSEQQLTPVKGVDDGGGA